MKNLRLLLAVCALFQFSAVLHAAPLPIGAEDDWAPFSSAVDGKPTGMAVDLVRAIFAEAGIEIDLRVMPYRRCMAETEAGRLAGCFDTTPDEELRRQFLFHKRPLFSDPTLIVARANAPAATVRLADLEGKRVAVTNGYTYGDAFETNTRIIKEVTLRDINGLRMLDVGRVDYAIVYRAVLSHLVKQDATHLKGKLKSVGTLQDNDLYVSFSRRYPHIESVISRFDAAQAKLAGNGSLRRIEEKWQ